MAPMHRRLLAAVGAAVLALALPSLAQAAVFTVTTTNDNGPGSLRAAITSANADATRDDISFDIGLGGAQTIMLLSPLPAISASVVLAAATTTAGPARRSSTKA